MQITDPLWKALPDRTPDVTAGEDITTLVTFTCHQTPDPQEYHLSLDLQWKHCTRPGIPQGISQGGLNIRGKNTWC